MEKKQAKTTVVKGTVTEEQAKALDSLIGTIGSNRQDVVGKIITIWLYNEKIMRDLPKVAGH
jgi:hypothetical protein